MLGVAIAVVALLKVLDIGMLVGFYRTFDPLSDPSYVGSGYGVLRDSVGGVRAVLVAVALGVAALAALVLLPLAAVRVTRAAARHRRAATTGVVVVGVVWALLPSSGRRPARTWGRLRPDQHGRRRPRGRPARRGSRTAPSSSGWPRATRTRRPPAQSLLAGLQGKDVLVVFVESYGRVALEDPRLAPTVTAAVDRATTGLGAAGFSGRSAYLTSPTFGGPQLAGALHAPDRPPDH